MTSMESSSNMIIRRPSSDDMEEIGIFIQKMTENMRFTYGEHDWKDTPMTGKNFEALTETFGPGNVLLGIMDGVLSGMVILTQKHAEKFRHVGNLTLSLLSEDFMEPLGRELISRMILTCKGKGVIRKVNLRVREDLFSIQEIYKALGFYEEGSLARDICLNGMFYSTLLYGRSID